MKVKFASSSCLYLLLPFINSDNFYLFFLSQQKREVQAVQDTPGDERRSKRSRNPASLYQSPNTETVSRPRKTESSTPKTPQDKLIIFFR